MKKIFLSAALIFFATQGHADWLGPYSVGTIEVNESGIFFGKPLEITSFPNSYNCPNASLLYFLGTSNIGGRILAVGLAAQMAGKKIRYYISGCASGYMQISNIEISP